MFRHKTFPETASFPLQIGNFKIFQTDQTWWYFFNNWANYIKRIKSIWNIISPFKTYSIIFLREKSLGGDRYLHWYIFYGHTTLKCHKRKHISPPSDNFFQKIVSNVHFTYLYSLLGMLSQKFIKCWTRNILFLPKIEIF